MAPSTIFLVFSVVSPHSDTLSSSNCEPPSRSLRHLYSVSAALRSGATAGGDFSRLFFVLECTVGGIVSGNWFMDKSIALIDLHMYRNKLMCFHPTRVTRGLFFREIFST